MIIEHLSKELTKICKAYDLCDACPLRANNMCADLAKYTKTQNPEERYKILKKLQKEN